MHLTNYINGFQHIALPTRNMDKTRAFYTSLGFDVHWEKENCPIYFKLKDIVIESWTDPEAPLGAGAWLHLSIDVSDIEAVHQWLTDRQYNLTTGKAAPKRDLFLTDKGVACVMIEGPNGETIEFNQIFI